MIQKKHIAGGALVLLLAGGGVFLSLASAQAASLGDSGKKLSFSVNVGNTGEEQGDNHGEDNKNGDSEQEKIDKQSDEIDAINEEEDGVHGHIDELNVNVTSSLPVVDAATLTTYGDIVAVIQTYNQELDRLALQASVTSTLGTALSPSEMVLLTSIVSKHSRNFNQLPVRIKEIKDQMKTLSDLLSPLSSTPIATVLKKPLVSALKDFREEILGLNDFERTSFDILNFETSN